MARRKKITRSTQLADRDDIREQLLKVFDKVSEGFNAQVDRSDEILDMWDIQNCKLSSKQFYSGNSRMFVPLVHNNLEARRTRFMGQLFPQAGRHVDVTTEDGEIPHAEMALLELYCDRAALRTKVVPALITTGDVEGQYTVCVTWGTKDRHTVSRETKPIVVGGLEHPELGEVEKITESEDEDAGPEVDIVPDPDFLVLPATAESIDEALDVGGSVTQLVRWSEERVQQAIDSGEIDDKEGNEYAKMIVNQNRVGDDQGHRNVPKKLAEEAGIKARGRVAHIYRTWTKIKVEGETRLVLAYYGGDQIVLGCKLCPYWNDKPDYISRPVKKMPGVFKGPSLVKPCADMQYFANDAINEGADSATYSMLPIVMTDPVKNPKIGTMVMDLMAVWETSPKDTQLVQFPQLYQHAFNIVQAAERYISQTLGVNPAMLPQSTGRPGVKRNQAEIALEQQVDIMSAEEANVVIESLLSEMLERFADYDAQFRDNEMTVRSVGELGVKAQMVTVPPAQMGKRWRYKWRGIAVKNTVQQIQQQVSALNVLDNITKGNPAVAQAGYRVNPVPLMKTIADNAFSPDLSPQIFVSVREEMSIDPAIENTMLDNGHPVDVSPFDDDAKHIQVHMVGARQSFDPGGTYQVHIMAHQRAIQMKAMQQMMQQAAQQAQQGGGAPAGPRPGATPAPPRGNAQQPAGRIHPDQMKGGVVQMPRRA